MKRPVRLALSLTGVAALAAAGVLYGVQGRAEWAQVGLAAVGSALVVAALPPVERIVGRLLERSRNESPRHLAHLAKRPSLYLIYAAWFASLGALGEVTYWIYSTRVSRYRVLGPEFLWQIPVAYLGVALVAGAMGVLAASRASARTLLRTLIFSFSFACLCGWLFLVGALHELAATTLAAGLAVQVARFAAAHPYVAHLIVRRTGAVLALVVTAMAAIGSVGPWWAERQSLAAVPAVSKPGANVILIVLDTTRAKSMGLYGYARPTTPEIDRFAARGVVFDHALSTAPWTLPSHGSMFTGQLPRTIGGDWMAPTDPEQRTIAEALYARGYLTAGFSANRGYTGGEFGLGRGFVHYDVHGSSFGDALRRTSVGAALTPLAREVFGRHDNLGRKSAEHVTRDALAWMSVRDRDRPYFVFLNYFDAHAPYLSPAEFSGRFSPTRPNGDIWSRPLDSWSPGEIAQLQNAYDGGLAYMDHHVGRLLDALATRGDLENTVVIITSDHGEQFGEHGLLEHSASLYMSLLHVPLAVVFPSRVPAERRVAASVSLRDLPATILDLSGHTDPVGFPGQSLTRYWTPLGDVPPPVDVPIVSEVQRVLDAYPDSYPARGGPMGSVVFEGRQYIRNHGTGREELYDLRQDPDATTDRAGVDPERVRRYRTYLSDAR